MEFFKRLFGLDAEKRERIDWEEYTQHVLSGPSLPGCDEKKGYAPDDPYMH